MYDSQIRQHNVRFTNIIIMKNVIAVVEKDRENKELLAMENVDKTTIAEVVKVLNAIDLKNKHNSAISNADMNVAGYLGLISFKKY